MNKADKICSVYRSSKNDELYVYVDKQDGLSRVPDTLKETVGELTLVMTLLIKEDKRLARVNGADVLSAIEKQGYYLQMPPPRDGYVTHYHGREN